MGRYEGAFRRSLADPAGFWGEAATAVDWYQEPQVILDDSIPPFYKGFAGGTLNTCHNALDRHVDGLLYREHVTHAHDYRFRPAQRAAGNSGDDHRDGIHRYHARPIQRNHGHLHRD